MDYPFSSGQFGSMDGGDYDYKDKSEVDNYTEIKDRRVDGLIHEVESLSRDRDSLLRRVADLEGETASLYHKLKAGDYLLNDLKSRVERFDLK